MDQIRLCAYNSLDKLSKLRPAWDDLLAHYPPATTFSTWEWLSSWWQSFGQGRQLLVLALFDSFSLVGLAPLSISKERLGGFSFRVLRMMGDGSNDSDNLDLPVRLGFEQVFATTLVQYLREQKRQWDIGLLNTLPQDSLVASHIKKALKSSLWTLMEYSSKSSAVPLPESWEQYTQKLASEDRNNLARYTRRLHARYSVRIYRCAERHELPASLEALFQLHQERWQSVGEPGSFSLPERRRFYYQLSERLLVRKCLELWVLELDQKIVAVQFAFRHGDKVFQLQEGYDHKRNSDRLGYVLRGAILKQLIAEKVRWYDFLGGEDSYKGSWGAEVNGYRNLHFAPSLGVGGAWLQLLNKGGRSKEWLRKNLPSSAWKFLNNANLTLRRHT